MNKLIFPLQRSLILPATQRPNKGLIVFLAGQFGLTYKVLPNPSEKSMSVELYVTDLSDPSWKYLLRVFNITEAGFPTGVILNQDALTAYDTAYSTLKLELSTIELELAGLEVQWPALQAAEEPIPEELIARVEELRTNHATTLAAIKEMGLRPTPELEYYNKYSDVINFFEKTGEITDDGILWAKNIPFFGAVLGDFI